MHGDRSNVCSAPSTTDDMGRAKWKAFREKKKKKQSKGIRLNVRINSAQESQLHRINLCPTLNGWWVCMCVLSCLEYWPHKLYPFFKNTKRHRRSRREGEMCLECLNLHKTNARSEKIVYSRWTQDGSASQNLIGSKNFRAEFFAQREIKCDRACASSALNEWKWCPSLIQFFRISGPRWPRHRGMACAFDFD